MGPRKLRAAIVGATSLLGRELAEQLANAATVDWAISLFDDEEAAGQVTAAGEEAIVIQQLEPGAFTEMDVVFFASEPAVVKAHWKEAANAGAAVVDLTGALYGEPGVPVLSPGMMDLAAVGLETTAVVSAHPAALLLALIAAPLRQRFGDVKLVVTLLEPASQQGRAGVDELQHQTAALLTFQSLPRDLYDAQVAFNLAASLGPEAKVPLAETSARISRDFEALSAGTTFHLQLLQAPVFNGYAASVFVEFPNAVSVADVRTALSSGALRLTPPDEDGPSNQLAVEQTDVLVSVAEVAGPQRGFWLFAAVDNIRLAALNAVACAHTLVKLKPAGKVQ